MYKFRRYRIGIPLSNVPAHSTLSTVHRRIEVRGNSRAKLRDISPRPSTRT